MRLTNASRLWQTRALAAHPTAGRAPTSTPAGSLALMVTLLAEQGGVLTVSAGQGGRGAHAKEQGRGTRKGVLQFARLWRRVRARWAPFFLGANDGQASTVIGSGGGRATAIRARPPQGASSRARKISRAQ